MGEQDRLLTAQEAADFLGLKVTTIRKMTSTRALRVVRPTGKRAVRYSLRDLQDLIRMRSEPARAGL